jgi:hypothetical protein
MMSSKKTETFSKQAIEKAFKENGIKFPLKDFIKSLKTVSKINIVKKKAIKKKPKFKTIEIYSNNIHPALKSGITLEDFIEEVVDNGDYFDMFDTERGMSDDGGDDVEYHKVGDKIYKVSLHCEAEWVGDWSVRKNLPGAVTVTDIKEIKNFKIIKTEKSYITIKL